MVAKIITQLEDILKILDELEFETPAIHVAMAIDLLRKDANKRGE